MFFIFQWNIIGSIFSCCLLAHALRSHLNDGLGKKDFQNNTMHHSNGKWIYSSILWKRMRFMVVLLIWNSLCANKAGRMEMNKLNKMYSILVKTSFTVGLFYYFDKGSRAREKKVWMDFIDAHIFFQIEKHLPYARFTNLIDSSESVFVC